MALWLVETDWGVVMHNKDGPAEVRTGSYELVKYDEETDELQAQPVYLYAPKKRDFAQELGGWFIGWQEGTMQLAKHKDLTLTDWRVLAVLQARLDFDNWIRISQSEIGREIDVAQPNVSSSMKKLLEKGVVLAGPATRGVKTYRLSPSLAFKGGLQAAAKERRAALRVVEGGKPAKAPKTAPESSPDPRQIDLEDVLASPPAE